MVSLNNKKLVCGWQIKCLLTLVPSVSVSVLGQTLTHLLSEVLRADLAIGGFHTREAGEIAVLSVEHPG